MNRIVEVSMGYQPRPAQWEVHQQLKRFSVLVAHRRFGKTVLSEKTLTDAALRLKRDHGRFGYVAPYLKQAKKVAWHYLCDSVSEIPGAVISRGELTVTVPNGMKGGAEIGIYGADNPDSLRGMYFDGVVLDEPADMKPAVWGNVIRPQLSDRLGWALFIGTPKGINLFSEMYYAAVDDPEWFAGFYPASMTDVIRPEELEMARKAMTEAQYRQEFECDFSAAVENQLITIDIVLEAMKREIREHDFEWSPRVLGVDVARYGGDRSVIAGRQGRVLFPLRKFRGLDNMQLADAVAHSIRKFKPAATFIDAGGGQGVIDRLRSLGHRIIEINFGGRAQDPIYENRRTEMWDRMADWLPAAAIPKDNDFLADACAPTYSWGENGRKRLEKKEDLLKRGLPSPDCGDAVALTHADYVGAQGQQVGTLIGRDGVAENDWDPFVRR